MDKGQRSKANAVNTTTTTTSTDTTPVHTIYGTMQGGNNWWYTLDNTYIDLGYTTSKADPCVRYKKEEDNYTLTDTYNDDVFGASNDDEEIRKRKEEMGKICVEVCPESGFY